MNTSARTIIEMNIKYFRERLDAESDPEKRKMIVQLLAEEEAKLAADDPPEAKRA
jgi:hypothetical protein